jgi:hypothetical protein
MISRTGRILKRLALVDEFELQVAGAQGHGLRDALGDDAHFMPPSRASEMPAPSCAQ